MATLRGFPNENKIAVFDEPNSSGSIEDFNASRNDPIKNPGQNISRVFFHTDFFQYELAMPIQSVNVNHPALAGRTYFWGPVDQYWIFSPIYTSAISYTVPGQTAVVETLLVSHGLGYVPLAFVAWNGRMLMPGVAVQVDGEGLTRFVSFFSTASGIYLREVYTSTESALGGTNQSYQVLIFKTSAETAGFPLMGINESNNEFILGRGKINTINSYLRRTGAGDTPFAIDYGPTVDLNSGRARIVSGGVFTTETGYAGSFTGPAFTSVGV